jgi:hypothetical protein
MLLKIIIVVFQVGVVKICVTTMEVQRKGKTRNVARVEMLKKNES